MSGHFSAENIGHGTPGHAPRPESDHQPSQFSFDADSEAAIHERLAEGPG